MVSGPVCSWCLVLQLLLVAISLCKRTGRGNRLRGGSLLKTGYRGGRKAWTFRSLPAFHLIISMFVVGAGILGGLLAFNHFWQGAVQRAAASYDSCLEAYEGRVARGEQPSTGGLINLYSVDHQEKILILGNFGYLVATCILYLVMVRRERPFQLRRVLTIYNLVNVLVSGYVSAMILHHKFTKQPGFICNRGEPGDPGLAYVFAVYYIQKYLEMADTYFFILRKSFRQVTFLHLFHHASITVIVGSLIPFDFDGDMYLPILLNSIVHVCVYMHYFVTCLGFQSWWSRYLTSLQMGQFGAIFVQSVLAYLEGPKCGSPDFSKLLMMGYMGSMLVLFSDFFFKRYILRQQVYDMCGVIKSVEFEGGPTCSAYHGSAKLNASGQAFVRLPRHFSSDVGISDTLYCYHLTAINTPMPELHVAQEITKVKINGTQQQGGQHAFMVGGGKPNGTVSWMVTVVAGDDKIRLH